MSVNYDEFQKEGMERSKKTLKQLKSASTKAPKEGRFPEAPARRTICRCLDDVESKPIRWLWPGRIACGTVTLIVGDPGLGKSQYCITGGNRQHGRRVAGRRHTLRAWRRCFPVSRGG